MQLRFFGPRWLGLLAAAVIVGAARAALWAAPAPVQEAPTSKRLVCLFNFEERQLGNFEELPMHWYVMGREPKSADATFLRKPLNQQLVKQPGFPTYTTVRFDSTQKTSGDYSLYLGLNGGNVGAFVEVGTIPAIPHSDYQISAHVRTTPLQYARARLLAYFIDDAGQRIDASVVSSPLLQTAEHWQDISIKLNGDFTQAAWIGLQVEVIQTPTPAQEVGGGHDIVYQDIAGGAWFDDIAVWQVPRVLLSTQNRVNIIRAPQQPELRLGVRDLAGQTLEADLAVYDHALRLVGRARQRVGNDAPLSWTWRPKLGRFGWYLADLVLYETGNEGAARTRLPLTRTLASFLWLPDEPEPDPADLARFSLDASGVSEDQLELMPALLQQARLGGVVLSCWDRGTVKATLDMRQAVLDKALEAITARGGQVMLNLAPLPAELEASRVVPQAGTIPLLGREKAQWWAYLSPILMRQGQRVRYWQLGPAGNPEGFYLPDLSNLLTTTTKEFRELAPQPQLVVPWRIDQARRVRSLEPPVFSIDVPASVRPRDIAAHITEWTDPPPTQYLLHLRSSSAAELNHERRVTDLALRMLYGWETGPLGLTITRPWTTASDRQVALLPDPLLGVFAEVTQRLAGRKVVGRLPVAPGVQCLILDGPAGGLLAAWTEGAGPNAALDMYLGPKPQTVDVWGNRRDIPLRDGRQRVALSDTPVFIAGVDAPLALFRAAFRVEPAFLESLQAPRQCAVCLTNPWPRTLSGSMVILEPKSWQIEPRLHNFSLAPGQSLRLPLTVSFPVSAVAGAKSLVARFNFTADQTYVLDLATPLELGLRGVRFDASLILERNAQTGRDDAVVTQTVTNTSDQPLALYAFANLPGYPRQEGIIPRLEPGQSVVRRFHFSDALAPLQHSDLRVGLREAAGPAVLNKVLSIRSAADP